MIKKIILFTKGIETLWYFSEQLGKELEILGYDVFYFDQCKEYRSLSDLIWFCEPKVTAAISFNFDGCSGEDYFIDSKGVSFFDAREVTFINIVVDHPFYYHKFAPYLPKKYIQISIDREHEAYLKRFFPEIQRGPFVPLGGTGLWTEKTLPRDGKNVRSTLYLQEITIRRRSFTKRFTGTEKNMPNFIWILSMI